ncbi:DUF881 domain-containing protein [Blastococcus sp. CT_GayMR19]|nr:DUF881 domain-containing protein [Blastococcus sp. CT_GayMR19]
MSEDQRPGGPGPADQGTGDDEVVPHPFGSGDAGAPAAGSPARGPAPPGNDAAAPDRATDTAAAPEAAPAPEPAPASKPTSTSEPAPAPEPAPASKPAPAPEPAPASEPGGTVAPDQPAAQVPEPGPPAVGSSAGEPPASTPAVGASRRRDPLAAVLIGVLTLLLGFAFAVQVRTVGDDPQLAGAREEDLVRILDELDAQEERLREQVAEQRSALEQLTNSDSRAATALEAARERAQAIGILNGTLPAQGPGLEMVIRDPDDEVRVADLLDAIQELRGAGAETMQIDDVRVGVSTAVTGDPGGLMVDGRPITAPYEILVIGDPQNMETAMNIPGGVVQHINNRGGSVTITQSEEVVVGALRPLDTPQYASPQTDD